MDWYVDMFGLTKRERGTIKTTADAGAVNLSFRPRQPQPGRPRVERSITLALK